MATISHINATCVYPGAETPSVDDLSIEVADGEFMVLVGPSGSGKSTALRMLAGLEQVSADEIPGGGVDVSHRALGDRDIAVVFQNYAPYPHMSVADNMGFVLKLSGVPKAQRDAKVREAAKLLDVEPYLDRKPKALSGGHRQRVAMGRATVREPSVFLMDQPLSNLDAMTMGHRVAVLRGGTLQQVDTPRNLYARPTNVFVAGFIGSPAMNLRTVALDDRDAQIADATIPLAGAALAAACDARLERLAIGLPPEAMSLGEKEEASVTGRLPLTVTLIEELSSDAYVYGRLDTDRPDEPPWVLRGDSRAAPTISERVNVIADPDKVRIFNPVTGSRLD